MNATDATPGHYGARTGSITNTSGAVFPHSDFSAAVYPSTFTSMWPWEHLAVGYLIYSAYVRARTGRRPDDESAMLLAVSTQLPDIVDKPLAWSFGLLSDGTAIGHSLLVVGPLLLLVAFLERKRSSTAYTPAIAIGVTSHLLADAVYPVLVGTGSVAPSVLLWPIVTHPGPKSGRFIAEFGRYFADFVDFLGTPLGRTYLLLEAVLVGVAVLAWIRDGVPGARPLTRPLEKVLPAE